MAKFKKLALVCASVMALSTVIAATACDPVESTSSSGTPEPAHVHTFGETQTWSKDATDHWYACTDAECDLKIGKQAHAWNEGEVTTEATEEADGVKTYTCTVCAQTKTEPIAKVVYDEPASGEGTWESPFVVTDGNYKIPFTYDEENGAGFISSTYTATADGTVTISYNEQTSLELYVNNVYVTAKADVTKIPVKKDDVIDATIGVNGEYWMEGATSYDVLLSVSSSTETMEADGSALLPYTLTAEQLEAYYGTVGYEYDATVSESVYVNYTVTGENTKGLIVSSYSAITGIQIVDNWDFNLVGGRESFFAPANSQYLTVEAGETVCFKLTPVDAGIKLATLSFGIEETADAYQDGTQGAPYVVENGESFYDLELPSHPMTGMLQPIYFSYTATENGTLSVDCGLADVLVNNESVWDYSSEIAVTAGTTYIILIGQQDMMGSPISPTFTFTAATVA